MTLSTRILSTVATNLGVTVVWLEAKSQYGAYWIMCLVDLIR